MLKIALMLATIVVVGGATFAVLTWFFRRLRRIEEELWGTTLPNEPFRARVGAAATQIRNLLRKP